MSEKKYYYRVIIEAESDNMGLLLLTQEEAENLNMLMNPKSWTAAKLTHYSGSVRVECDYPLSEEFVDCVLKEYPALLEDDIVTINNTYSDILRLMSKGLSLEEACADACCLWYSL